MLGIGRWTFCLVLLLLCSCKPAPKPPTKLYQLPPFKLTERSGRPFESASAMPGKAWLACFFFTNCPGPCEQLNQRMSVLHKATAALGPVSLISISTDEDDTPAKLTDYATKKGADARWLFLTGKKDEVFDLSIKGFKLVLADAPAVSIADKFIHSTKIALIDKQGWIRGYYEGIGENQNAETERLLADLKRILAEP